MSLRGDAYETHEEIKFRLEGSVVLYDGDPVIITRVNHPEAAEGDEIARVLFQKLPFKIGKAGRETRKYLSSRKFDLAPFRMGYFNCKDEATFASRIPTRQNKQGLTANTCSLTNVKGRRSETVTFHDVINSQGFADMVAGKYPTFAEARAMFEYNKNTLSVAVSRSFALWEDKDLDALLVVHKGAKCGIALKGQKTVNLPPKFHFLREEFEECRIPLT